MKVTGWTYYENPDYRDVCEEYTRLCVNATRDIPKIPNYFGRQKYTQEELEKLLDEHTKAFNSAIDTDEIKSLAKLKEELIETVIKDVKEHGYHFSGDSHQAAEWGVPIIDDKYMLCVSSRSWGQIMAKAFPEEISQVVEDVAGTGYIVWAWNNSEYQNAKVKVPDKALWVGDRAPETSIDELLKDIDDEEMFF